MTTTDKPEQNPERDGSAEADVSAASCHATEDENDPLRAITSAMVRLSYAAAMLNDLLDPDRITSLSMVESSAVEARGSVAEAMATLTQCMQHWSER